MNYKLSTFGIMGLLIVLSTIGYRYYDYFIAKNISLYAFTPCSPDIENCFISSEESAYFEFQLEPYKKIEILDKYAPTCLEEHTCENFSCDGIESCIVTYCSEETLEDGEYCYEETFKSTNEENDVFPDINTNQEQLDYAI